MLSKEDEVVNTYFLLFDVVVAASLVSSCVHSFYLVTGSGNGSGSGSGSDVDDNYLLDGGGGGGGVDGRGRGDDVVVGGGYVIFSWALRHVFDVGFSQGLCGGALYPHFDFDSDFDFFFSLILSPPHDHGLDSDFDFVCASVPACPFSCQTSHLHLHLRLALPPAGPPYRPHNPP